MLGVRGQRLTDGLRRRGRERECSVVVPVYNSQATLPALIERLAAVLPGVADRFEVVLVNDGSRDESWDGICQAARKHAWVRGINLMRNYGQHNALLAGIRAARYAVTVTMDDDLQHPPEEIPRLLEALGQGNDLVYGTSHRSRSRGGRGPCRRGSRSCGSTGCWGWPSRPAPAPSGRSGRCCARASPTTRARRSPIDALLAWTTTRIASVDVRHEPRRHGRSQYGWLKLARLAIDLTTTFRTWPLRLASLDRDSS